MSDNVIDTDPLVKYLCSNSEDEDFNPSPPKTPDYRADKQNNLDFMDYDEGDDTENSPPPSQPRPNENTTHQTGNPPKSSWENSLPKLK